MSITNNKKKPVASKTKKTKEKEVKAPQVLIEALTEKEKSDLEHDVDLDDEDFEDKYSKKFTAKIDGKDVEYDDYDYDKILDDCEVLAQTIFNKDHLSIIITFLEHFNSCIEPCKDKFDISSTIATLITKLKSHRHHIRYKE